MLDFNDAPAQRGDLIPAGTICVVQMVVRAGGAGEDGWLKRSANGGSEGLDIEYTIVEGEFAKRKIWQFMVLTGSTDGHAKAAEISRGALRAILESVRGINPKDTTEEAQIKRKADIADFCNLRFLARVTVEKSKDPNYNDKNKLEAVTPDDRRWVAVEQIPSVAQGNLPGVTAVQASKPVDPISRPDWAQ